MMPRSLFLFLPVLLVIEGGWVSAQGVPNLSVSSHPLDRSLNPQTSVQFRPRPGDERPDTTRGAGSRHDRQCAQDISPAPVDATAPALTALVPPDHYGLTTSDRPTFWIYLPPTSAENLVLSVREDGTQQRSHIVVPITEEPGIMGIRLAESLPPLEVGKTYEWAVVLVCGEQPGPNDPVATGWVRRVAFPQAPDMLGQSTALAQAQWYGQNGIWYDAVTSLAQFSQSPSVNVEQSLWSAFLSQPLVELNAIATKPLRFPILP